MCSLKEKYSLVLYTRSCVFPSLFTPMKATFIAASFHFRSRHGHKSMMEFQNSYYISFNAFRFLLLHWLPLLGWMVETVDQESCRSSWHTCAAVFRCPFHSLTVKNPLLITCMKNGQWNVRKIQLKSILFITNTQIHRASAWARERD